MSKTNRYDGNSLKIDLKIDPNVWDNYNIEDSYKKSNLDYTNNIKDQFKLYLKHIIDSNTKKDTQKQKFKTIFFYVTMFIFAGLIVCQTVFLCIIFFKTDIYEIEKVALLFMLSITVEIIASIIILPKIIAEYLFNKEEDKSTTDIMAVFHNYLSRGFIISQQNSINKDNE